ncbi:MAG TPA: hypothetical protein VJR89_15800 [Polyangiales bacterium]|nr:hypothetical protein [Polyangiales bacterium]
MTSLVALEDAALETVAGGSSPALDIVQKEFNLDFDLDLDVDVKVVNFIGNQIVAQDYSTVDIDIDN